MAPVPGREDRAGSFAAPGIRILRIPAVDPAALALGREQRKDLVAREADREHGGAVQRGGHGRRSHAVYAARALK
jgi:hypothetical protein